ncbi:unnamed protein product [Phytophthora lilii]|uniref:Unnamed protein product n=1 Tax=Phytophthora lilii TaxID=2077276 RepID=A0A9W6TE46_9STRA|nr:unnamed protein product [Phytophthora lilii]
MSLHQACKATLVSRAEFKVKPSGLFQVSTAGLLQLATIIFVTTFSLAPQQCGIERIAMPRTISPDVKLSPSPSRSTQTERNGSNNRLKAWWARITRLWLATQLTNYGGKYSVDACAGRVYSNDVSASCTNGDLSDTIPMVLLMLGQEAIPLQDPTEGWSINYGFWLRVVILQGILAYTSAVHAASTIDGATLNQDNLLSSAYAWQP